MACRSVAFDKQTKKRKLVYSCAVFNELITIMEEAIVLDAELKNMLTCSICLEMFNNSCRTPKFLFCFHSLCLTCLKVSALSRALPSIFSSIATTHSRNFLFPCRDWKWNVWSVLFVATRLRWSQTKLLSSWRLIFIFYPLWRSVGLPLCRPEYLSSRDSLTFSN